MFVISFLLRMTETMTSQNIVLSSWDTLYIVNEIRSVGAESFHGDGQTDRNNEVDSRFSQFD
jgi:hypothetical protein